MVIEGTLISLVEHIKQYFGVKSEFIPIFKTLNLNSFLEPSPIRTLIAPFRD